MKDRMQEYSFQIEKCDKPIIYVKNKDNIKTACLIDTGANTPVWVLGEDYLKYRYPDAKKSEKKSILNGMGERPVMNVPVWIIPEFILEDNLGNCLVYKDLYVCVIDSDKFSFDMIIPLTMLNRMDFSFTYTESVNYALFKISAAKQNFYTRPVYAESTTDYLNKIQIFAQDEFSDDR